MYNDEDVIFHLVSLVVVVVFFYQLNSPEDSTTLVNLMHYLQDRQRRRQTLIDDLSRKGIVYRIHCT